MLQIAALLQMWGLLEKLLIPAQIRYVLTMIDITIGDVLREGSPGGMFMIMRGIINVKTV